MEFNLTRDHLERVRSLFKSLWGRPNKANANVSGVGQASCIFLEHLRFYEPTSKPLVFTVTLFAQGSSSCIAYSPGSIMSLPCYDGVAGGHYCFVFTADPKGDLAIASVKVLVVVKLLFRVLCLPVQLCKLA